MDTSPADEQEPVGVDIPVFKANSVSNTLYTLSGDFYRTDERLAEAIGTFADRYSDQRVNAERDEDTGTVEIRLTPEGFRMVAAFMRLDGLRRSTPRSDGKVLPMTERIAEDHRDIARLFDRAAEEAEATLESRSGGEA